HLCRFIRPLDSLALLSQRHCRPQSRRVVSSRSNSELLVGSCLSQPLGRAGYGRHAVRTAFLLVSCSGVDSRPPLVLPRRNRAWPERRNKVYRRPHPTLLSV